MRQFLTLLVVVFVVAFAWAIARHLANEGRAFAVGMLIGVAASVPASLLAAFVVRSAADRARRPVVQPALRAEPPAPPVVIVNPGQASRSSRYVATVDDLMEPRQPRTFTVNGDDPDPPTAAA